MGMLASRRSIRRSPLGWRGTPSSLQHRPAAAAEASSNAARATVAPVLEWLGKETRSQAEKLNDDRLEVLLPRLPHVGRALLKCDGADHPCRLPICAVCARAYREGAIPQLHALAHACVGPHEVATIYLRLFEPGSLADADPRRIREMFRKRLDRAGFKNANWWAASRWPGRRNGSAGSCMPTSSPSASTRSPGSSSKPPWKTAAPRGPSITSRCATPPSSSPTASSSLAIINPDAALCPCRRIASSNLPRGGRDIASRTSCSPMAPVVAATASSSMSSRSPPRAHLDGRRWW